MNNRKTAQISIAVLLVIAVIYYLGGGLTGNAVSIYDSNKIYDCITETGNTNINVTAGYGFVVSPVENITIQNCIINLGPSTIGGIRIVDSPNKFYRS